MRLNVNLATRPYEDLGTFLRRWGVLTLLLALVTGGLVYYSVHNWQASADVNRQIARMEDEMGRLDKDRAVAQATLDLPQNKTIVEQSKFFNNAIQRKALSWTRVFMDLERIMPSQLHVVSITPELNKENQLLLHLQVAGQSREKAIELVRRMEESPTFKNAELHNETMLKEANRSDMVQFEITSLYVPSYEHPGTKGATNTTALAESGAGQ